MKDKVKLLSLLLLLTSIHSFMVGVGLMFIPHNMINLIGFGLGTDRFFQIQGGVFHIIMAIGYFLTSKQLNKYRYFVDFTILIKFIAALFLLTYYFFYDSIFTVFLSGIIDFLIGAVLLSANISFKKELQKKDKAVL